MYYVEQCSPTLHIHQELVNVNLFAKRVFAVVIKLTRGHTGIGWILNAVGLVSLLGDGYVDIETWTHTKKKIPCEA